MNKNLVIFDADSLCYIGGKEDTLQQILEKVDNKINEVLLETKADYYVLLVSKGKYFRHDISKSSEAPDGTYKSNRVYGAQIYVRTVKEYLIAQYGAVWYPKLEADDIAAWLMHKPMYWCKYTNPHSDSIWMLDSSKENADEFEDVNKILVAKDKDLLYSIPGKHLNFSCKLDKDTWGMKGIETKESEASFFQWNQMVIGDTSDGIKGLHRKGESWCKKNSEGKSLNEWIHIIFDEYLKEYGTEKGIYEFSKNKRLLYMLTEDSDYLREVGYIPELPEFQKVYKSEELNLKKLDF